MQYTKSHAIIERKGERPCCRHEDYMLLNKQALVIMNPSAGQKSANRYLIDIIAFLNTHGYITTVLTTTKAVGGDALAMTYGQGYDLIICIGGDGTLHQVISGVISGGLQAPIAYIPAGTTNDFARSLDIPTDPMRAVQNAVLGSPRALDIGLFNQEKFTYVASCGAFTSSSYSASRSLKNAIGHLAYILESIRALPDIRPIHLTVETENAVYEDDYIFAAVCNTTSLGGILRLKEEQVDLCDGKLECLLIRSPKNMIEFTQIIRSLQTMEYNAPLMHFFRTSHAVFHTPPTLDWSLDGEHTTSSKEVSIGVISHAIRLMLPKKAKHPSQKLAGRIDSTLSNKLSNREK